MILWIWLGLAGLTGCGTVYAAWLAVTGRQTLRGWATFVRSSLAAVALVAIIDAVLRAFPRSAGPSGRLMVGVVATLAAAALLRIPVPTAGRRGWLTAGMLGGACAVSASLFALFARPNVWDLAEFQEARVVLEDKQTGAHAVTDRGSLIPLGHFEPRDYVPDVPEGFSGQVIVADEAVSNGNCHGWVFTDGRFHVAGELVDRILSENSYTIVTTPQPGDVVVYRDEAGAVLHTGVVKSTGVDGFVLIESKWGPLHTYWHTPESQAYSQRFEYWRSPRDGHLLRIVDAQHDAAQSADAP